jgi:nucleoside-diphosphate-sugar epimerase
MRAVVTGGTGFLGSHLVHALRAAGHDVAVLARNDAKARSVLPHGCEVLLGDICDAALARKLVAGADLVFHTVSNFRTASGAAATYRRINVEGTTTVLEAAIAANVARFVHCSTIGVHGDVASSPGNEESPFNPGDLYQETKLEAERAVARRVGASATQIVIVRPCSLYGPGDTRMLKMFRMLARGTFFKVGACRANFHAGYIDDVVDGFLRAASVPGIDGEAFIVGGSDYVPLEAYIDTAADAVGASPPRVRLPYALMYSAAWGCERVCAPFGVEPPLHVRRVRFFRNNRAFSIDKARDVLGYSPKIDLRDGMRRTVAWYKAQGLLRPNDVTAESSAVARSRMR